MSRTRKELIQEILKCQSYKDNSHISEREAYKKNMFEQILNMGPGAYCRTDEELEHTVSFSKEFLDYDVNIYACEYACEFCDYVHKYYDPNERLLFIFEVGDTEMLDPISVIKFDREIYRGIGSRCMVMYRRELNSLKKI